MNDYKHIEGLLDPADYPSDQEQLVLDFNKKLLAISEENTRLTMTVSKKEQERLTRLLDAIRVYNINITKRYIEDEIFETIDGEQIAMLESMGLPCPCPLDMFTESMAGYLEDEDKRADFKNHLNPDRLIEEFYNGNVEQTLTYELKMNDHLIHTIQHSAILTEDKDENCIIAMCSARDITRIADTGRRLSQAQTAIQDTRKVMEALVQDYSVIWLIDGEDQSLKLFRTLGNTFIPEAILMGMEHGYYTETMTDYADTFIYAEDRERVKEEASFDNMVKIAEEYGIATVNYRRLDIEGNMSYFQVVLAKMGDEDENRYILAFKDIDSTMKKEFEQVEIVKALSHEYLDVFKINMSTGEAIALKFNGNDDGPTLLNTERNISFSYEKMLLRVIAESVYPDDREDAKVSMKLETVIDHMKKHDEYTTSFRTGNGSEIHYIQCKYIRMNHDSRDENIVAGYKNIDEVVNAARERENLIVLSETDIMTGLLNRGSGQRRAASAIKRGTPGLLCLLDIDNFKSINDTFGHLVGDMVITEVASSLKCTFRDRDIIFRLGGDEFAAFAVGNMNEQTATEITNRFFDKLNEIDIPEMKGRKVTASVGMVIVNPNKEENTFDDLYKLADKCVYESKKTKGNQMNYTRVK